MEKIKKIIWIGMSVIIIMHVIGMEKEIKGEELTIEKVIEAEKKAGEGIKDVKAEVETEIESGGRVKKIRYEYEMEREGGEVKMIVRVKGKYGMEFKIDTKEGSVEYLMSNGEVKKYKISEEEKEEIRKKVEVGMLIGYPYKDVGKYAENKGIIRDAVYKIRKGKEYEDERIRIRVNKKREWWIIGDEYAEIEYEDKRKKEEMEEEIRERIRKMKEGKAETEGGKRMRERYIEYIRGKMEEIKRGMVVKRREEVDMKSGEIRGIEYYNAEGERIGWIRNKYEKKRIKYKGKDIEKKMLKEAEGEMRGIRGISRYKSRIKWKKINEGVDMEWRRVK